MSLGVRRWRGVVASPRRLQYLQACRAPSLPCPPAAVSMHAAPSMPSARCDPPCDWWRPCVCVCACVCVITSAGMYRALSFLHCHLRHFRAFGIGRVAGARPCANAHQRPVIEACHARPRAAVMLDACCASCDTARMHCCMLRHATAWGDRDLRGTCGPGVCCMPGLVWPGMCCMLAGSNSSGDVVYDVYMRLLLVVLHRRAGRRLQHGAPCVQVHIGRHQVCRWCCVSTMGRCLPARVVLRNRVSPALGAG